VPSRRRQGTLPASAAKSICAAQKERRICSNTVSIRKEALEIAALAVLKDHLLTDEHARLFAEECRREMNAQCKTIDERDAACRERPIQVEAELANLTADMLAGVLSPTLIAVLRDREAEKADLEAVLASKPAPVSQAEILPHPALIALFREKIGALHASLNDEAVRPAIAVH
jgi:site-specific DNA recombinase